MYHKVKKILHAVWITFGILLVGILIQQIVQDYMSGPRAVILLVGFILLAGVVSGMVIAWEKYATTSPKTIALSSPGENGEIASNLQSPAKSADDDEDRKIAEYNREQFRKAEAQRKWMANEPARKAREAKDREERIATYQVKYEAWKRKLNPEKTDIILTTLGLDSHAGDVVLYSTSKQSVEAYEFASQLFDVLKQSRLSPRFIEGAFSNIPNDIVIHIQDVSSCLETAFKLRSAFQKCGFPTTISEDFSKVQQRVDPHPAGNPNPNKPWRPFKNAIVIEVGLNSDPAPFANF